ncbi:MAG: lamin tail domain-containing protein [bacterium]
MKYKALANLTLMFILMGILLFPHLLQADSLDVCINEIAWMGTEASSNDEWIELYNHTDRNIDLTNYTLVAEDGSPEILLSDTIEAHSYFLLERSDDQTVSDIEADLIYTGSLGNTGEYLFLKDSNEVVVDRVNCAQGWFAGDNDGKISMERISPLRSGSDSLNWNTNNGIITNGLDADTTAIKGTPGQQNSVYQSISSLPVSTPMPEKIGYIYNYPNPFNPVTKIYCNFSPDNTTRLLSMYIFNIQGQKVRTLLRGKQVKGNYAVTWDGWDDRGHDLPSGIYFLHLYDKSRIIATAKMLKLK